MSDSDRPSTSDANTGGAAFSGETEDRIAKAEDYCVNYQSIQKHVFGYPANNTRPSKYGRLFEAIAFDVLVSVILLLMIPFWISSDEDILWMNYVLGVVPLLGAAIHMKLLTSHLVAKTIIFTFEFLFVFINVVMWTFAQCTMFGWDERCVGIFSVFFVMSFVMLGDAANDHGLFYYRKYLFAIHTVLVCLILLFSFGRVFRDVQEHKTRCNLYSFTCSDNVTQSIRNVSGDRYKMEPVYSFDVFSDFRLGLILLYFIKWSIASFHKRRCTILSTLTRRELIHDPTVLKGLLAKEEEEASTRVLKKKKKSAPLKIRRTLSRAVNELDEESKRRIEVVTDNSAIIDLYFPGAGHTVVNGPQYTVLAWTLLGDFKTAERINGFLERNVKWTQRLFLLGWPLVFLALAEVLPYECMLVVLLTLPDPLRVIWKLNKDACLLVMQQMNFWLPVCGCLVFAVGLIVSFSFDLYACIFGVIFFICMISALLSDADVHRRILGKQVGVIMYVICALMIVMFIFLLLLGVFPKVRNKTVDFSVWNNEVQLGSVSIAASFAGYPILFIVKFIWTSLKNPTACRIISVPMYRISVRKSELPNVLRALSDEANKLALLEKGGYDVPVNLSWNCNGGVVGGSRKVAPCSDEGANAGGLSRRCDSQ